MKYLKALSLCAGLIIGGLSLQAQSLDEIVNKNTAVMGGADKLKAIKTQYTEGNMEIQGMQVPVRRWVKQGEAMRLEFDIMGTKNIQVVTKNNGWQLMPAAMKNDVEDIDGNMLKLIRSQLDVTGELFDYAAKGKKVELVGKDTVNGAPAFKLKVTNTENITGIAYVDAASFYLVKATNEVEVQGQKAQIVTLLSDYKKTPDGYAYPGTTEQSPIGMKMNITKVEVNQPIADSLFTKPVVQ
ncbi:MAG TPA: hypothetical protein VM802_11590 [Chitinophaga sp.]|uniref:hypothetical protein n=1 Tax=Chitinophaga sp. TaxID=1869181 RepID=UPI002BBC177B|nr:hypothetical protein [Chitinophaga sp.]HVI45509.1 hypothetical protein [Chitinophaga sp.]